LGAISTKTLPSPPPAARDAQNRLLWRKRLEHAHRPRLRAQLAIWPKGTPVIFEASFGWGWFADQVQAAQLDPHLASSRKVAAWRQARGLAKSNRLDAELISELWGQQPRWWEVWLAPPPVRDQREWLRYRMALVRIQTGLKNRIHAVLHRHGIIHGFSDLFGRDGRRFLSLLAGPRDVTLPDSARAILKGQLQLLDHDRRTDGGRRNRNRGYIAVAHELAHLVDIIWRRGVEYTKASPPRPGWRRRRKGSGPGRGQPVAAMVGVVE
jgi:transposase